MTILTTERDAILNALLPGASHASYSGNTQLFLSLHTADPGNTGASPFVGDYTAPRREVAFGASSGQSAAQTARLDFLPNTGGTITHAGFYTAASGGTFKGGAALASSKTVADGEILRFEIGAVTVALA
jgi:hypothetical protein